MTFPLFTEEHITKNCQQDITVVGEGFVETPGYPQFNVERNCSWKLRTQEGQRVQLSFLDISLRGTCSVTSVNKVLRISGPKDRGTNRRMRKTAERETSIFVTYSSPNISGPLCVNRLMILRAQ
jgi:hypothetical protein